MSRSSKSGIRGLFKTADGRWQIDLRWREPGTGEYRRHTELLPEATTAATAKERTRRILAAALAGGFNPRQEAERKLAAALGEYTTWRADNGKADVALSKRAAARFVASFGDVELTAVSPFAIERFKRDRAVKAGPSTVNRDLAILRHFFGMAAKWGWMPKAHAVNVREIQLLREPPGRVRYLSPDEESRLMTALAKRPRLRRIVVAALLTGMRQAELSGLRREDVSLVTGEITLTKTKSNRVRRIPIAAALRPVLEEALASSRTGFVFESRDGKPYTRNGLRSAWDRARIKAKLKGFNFHDLRHSCATALRRAGAGLDVIAKILGHSTLAMTQRYAHVGDDLTREAIAGLPPLASPLPVAPKLSVVK